MRRLKKEPLPAPDIKDNHEHIVRKGETIDGIAKKHGVSRKDILAANPELKLTTNIYGEAHVHIEAGQKLVIPVKGSGFVSPTGEAKQPAKHSAPDVKDETPSYNSPGSNQADTMHAAAGNTHKQENADYMVAKAKIDGSGLSPQEKAEAAKILASVQKMSPKDQEQFLQNLQKAVKGDKVWSKVKDIAGGIFGLQDANAELVTATVVAITLAEVAQLLVEAGAIAFVVYHDYQVNKKFEEQQKAKQQQRQVDTYGTPPGGSNQQNPDPDDHDNHELTRAKDIVDNSINKFDLNQHEGNEHGGHTKERHVGKVKEWLEDRLQNNPHIMGSTSYPDLETANRITQETLKRNSDQIAKWLGDKNSAVRYSIGADFQKSIGYGFDKNGNYYDKITKVNIVLKKTNNGFKVLTSHPVVDRIK